MIDEQDDGEVRLEGKNVHALPPPTPGELAWAVDEAGCWLVKTVLGEDGVTRFEFEPTISEELRGILEARRSASCGDLPVLGIENIRDIRAALQLAEPERDPFSGIETWKLQLSPELKTRLENSLALVEDGVDGNRALGINRGRGNKTRGIESNRRWALAWLFELLLRENPDANRGRLAEEVAASALGTLGRPKPFGPRYIQMLHRKLLKRQSFANLSGPELGLCAGMVLLVEEDLRARYEK